MPREYKNLATIEPFSRLIACLVSKEKMGKSWLCTTARKPVLFFDFDGRADALPRTKDVYALTYREPSGQKKQPTVITDFLNDLTLLEGAACDIGNAFPNLGVPRGTIAKTIVYDSGTWMAKASMKYALYTNKELARVLSIGGIMDVSLVKSFDGWNAEMQTVESVIARAMAMPTLPDFILTFHETAEESPGSTGEKPLYTGKYNVFPARYEHVPSVFNDLWRLEMVPSKQDASKFVPRVQVKANERFNAATSMPGLSMYEEANIEQMIAKHIASGLGQVLVKDPVALAAPAIIK